LEGGAVFVPALGAGLYILTLNAPGRAQIDAFVQTQATEINAFVDSRTTDQHFSRCAEARAAGRQNVPRWDPSYRAHMDRHADGLACEPIGHSSVRSRDDTHPTWTSQSISNSMPFADIVGFSPRGSAHLNLTHTTLVASKRLATANG
jgi:hypothetical protein